MGGMETHLHALCGELGRSLDVNVIVANEARRRHEGKVDGIRVARLANLATLRSAPLCPQMPAAIRALRSDIVHIHLPNPGALIAYLMSGWHGPLVLTWHSDIVRQRLLARALIPLERWFVRNAAQCIATSPAYLESSPILSASPGRCRVIPYGIALENFVATDNAVAELRARHGPRLVLTVGRLIYYKGFDYLLRAMTRVEGRLIIVGDGPLRPKLEHDARAMGIRDHVFFAGEVHNSKLAPWYHAADVFVLPSVARSEAFGIVQLEAMACSKPIVNTRLDSGVPFVSPDGLTGITVPPRDAPSLAQAITRLLDDAELRGRYGAAGFRRVRSEFTLRQMAARTVQLYHEIVAGSERRHQPAISAAASVS